MSASWLLGLGVTTLRLGVPYIMAALGGTVSERAGVINIALEGLLLLSALGAALGAPHGAAAAALAGLGAGLAAAAVFGLLTVLLRANQVVCGVAMFLLADGLSRFLLKVVYGSTSNSPRLGQLEGHWAPLFVTGALLAGLLLHGLLGATTFGLRLRAVGEHPAAARSLGVPVHRVRLLAVLLSGLLTSVGGIWLVFDQRQFVALMSGGRGFIALAAMIFGGWRPLGAVGAALLFALAEALAVRLQAQGLPLPNYAVQMLPCGLTLVALGLRGAMGTRGSRPPAALGQPLD
ncbi:MAG: ABC transporter permease [Myxococcales bacterium]|nr:ABC transporter permease [Myxococcales bacterium]